MSDVYNRPETSYDYGEVIDTYTDEDGVTYDEYSIVETEVDEEYNIYSPIDTTEYVSSLDRPLCSMSFNGIVFEEEIPGYRTVRVEGRDSYQNTIYNYSTRINPGSRFQDFHEESRDITVTFSMHAYNPYDLRRRIDTLKGFLRDPNNKEAHIIFNDEPDVYYVGTVSSFSEEKLTTVSNSAGQIVITCSDIRKYAVEETGPIEATADTNHEFLIDYNGNMPAYPRFEVEASNGDINQFGFIDEDGHLLQFGYPGTVDNAKKLDKAYTIINQDFRKSYPSEWGKPQDQHPNHATVSPDIEGYPQHGIIYTDGTSSKPGTIGIYPKSYYEQSGGKDVIWTDEDEYDWHGPSTTRTVLYPEHPGADGSTSVGAKDWKLNALLTQWQNEPKQEGLNVILKNNYDVLGCHENKLFWDKNIEIPFAAFEGSKQIPCKVKSITEFLDGELKKKTASKANSEGLIQFTLAKGMSVPEAWGKVIITFTVTYSGGTLDIKKTYFWDRQNLEAARKAATYYIMLDKYEVVLNCQLETSTNRWKTTNDQTVHFDVNAYKGKNRFGAQYSETESDFLGKKIKAYKSPTNKASGYVEWLIPKGTYVDSATGSMTLKFTFKEGDKSTVVTDQFHYTRNRTPVDHVNGYSTVKLLQGRTNIILPVQKDNQYKTFKSQVFKMEFRGFEGTAGRAASVTTNDSKLFGIKPKMQAATKEKNGYLQWTIPAGTKISGKEGYVRLAFRVTTQDFNVVTLYKEIHWFREEMSDSRTDYSQLGGMAIVVAGATTDNVMQSIAEIQFFKNKTNAAKATCYLYLDKVQVHAISYDCLRTNPLTGTNKGKNKTGAPIQIEKSGNTYRFTVGGKVYSYTNHNGLIAQEVSVIFYRYRNNNVLERQAVKTIKFTRYPEMATATGEIISAVNGIVGGIMMNTPPVKNLFSNGDSVTIDCQTGEILINGIRNYNYGALGNDWEDFSLKPGPNRIKCVWDTDSGDPPTFNMYYREVR